MFFFQTFQGFPKPPSFWQRFGMSPIAQGLKSYCGPSGRRTYEWQRPEQRDSVFWGFWVWKTEVGRWIEAMGCHTDSSYLSGILFIFKYIWNIGWICSAVTVISMKWRTKMSHDCDGVCGLRCWDGRQPKICPNLNSCAVLPFWGYPIPYSNWGMVNCHRVKIHGTGYIGAVSNLVLPWSIL